MNCPPKQYRLEVVSGLGCAESHLSGGQHNWAHTESMDPTADCTIGARRLIIEVSVLNLDRLVATAISVALRSLRFAGFDLRLEIRNGGHRTKYQP